MLLRNFKSSADEVSKRNLANELLKVEIENEAILEQRIGNYQNPNAPPPVPPTYKSNSDLMKDLITQEKTAIDNLMSMDFDYNDATSIVKWLSGTSEKGDKLIKFNQGFPFIKSDIQKKFNPRLVDVSFMEGYLDKYFEDVNISFGFAFNRDNEMSINSLSELKDILPSIEKINDLAQMLQAIGGVHIDGEVMGDIFGIVKLLTENLLTDEDIADIGLLNQYQRIQLFKKIVNAVKKGNIPRPAELREIEVKLQKYQASPDSVRSIGNNLLKRLSGISYNRLDLMREIKADIQSLIPPKGGAEFEEIDLPMGDAEQSGLELNTTDQEILKSVEHIRTAMVKLTSRADWRHIYPEIIKILTKLGVDAMPNGITIDDLQTAVDNKKKIGITNDALTQQITQLMEDMLRNTPLGQSYDPKRNQIYKLPKEVRGSKGVIGFGSKTAKAVKKHFKEDEKFLKKVAKELEDDSSSDEETMKALHKHSKAEKPYEAKIEKAVGAGYIHRRIPVKKIVGKGIEVEEQPTYKTFGKYVMHIPHLLNNNVLNLKYPSLGSIPAIKPMTISEDYKDFVIDVMNTGRVNDKAYTQLQPHEKKHFERITKGAGLIDTFKLKRSSDDDDKADEDRFNLLRGNYLAGNNSDTLVKELKGLVVKFMGEGRIHRNEGLNLLMELSVI